MADRRELGIVEHDIFGLDELSWNERTDDFLTKLMDDREKYYANKKDDPGGKTIWGLTTKTYGKGFIDRLEKMDPEESKEVARTKYKTDHLAKAEKLFGKGDVTLKFADISINTGESNAIGIVQKALNKLLPESQQISVDKAAGIETKKAITNIMALFSAATIKDALEVSQMEYYEGLSAIEQFSGWRTRALYDPAK